MAGWLGSVGRENLLYECGGVVAYLLLCFFCSGQNKVFGWVWGGSIVKGLVLHGRGRPPDDVSVF